MKRRTCPLSNRRCVRAGYFAPSASRTPCTVVPGTSTTALPSVCGRIGVGMWMLTAMAALSFLSVPRPGLAKPSGLYHLDQHAAAGRLLRQAKLGAGTEQHGL